MDTSTYELKPAPSGAKHPARPSRRVPTATRRVGISRKSHHNVGGLPDSLHPKLLEPLREQFKDEVRELGVALGLLREMVYCHAGPGLGVRILGEMKREYVSLLQRAYAIFIEE